MKIEPSFWYESNAFFGRIYSIKILNEALKYQLEENNNIENIDCFLDKSMKTEDVEPNFGTRREHTSNYSLRQFLKEHNLLDAFIHSNEAERFVALSSLRLMKTNINILKY